MTVLLLGSSYNEGYYAGFNDTGFAHTKPSVEYLTGYLDGLSDSQDPQNTIDLNKLLGEVTITAETLTFPKGASFTKTLDIECQSGTAAFSFRLNEQPFCAPVNLTKGNMCSLQMAVNFP